MLYRGRSLWGDLSEKKIAELEGRMRVRGSPMPAFLRGGGGKVGGGGACREHRG